MYEFAYIYLLAVSCFTGEYKIGSTNNPYNRHNNYGGYYGSRKYSFEYLIKIKKVPNTRERTKQKHLSDLEYVEKILLHEYFKGSRIRNPSSNMETEFFNNQSFEGEIPYDKIIEILTYNKIFHTIAPKYSENIEHYKEINKSIQEDKEKKDKDRKEYISKDSQLEREYFDRWFSKSFVAKDFIMNRLLNGNQLRCCQEELYGFMSNDDNLTNGIKGIIKWPTGTGKRIGIIICILLTYLFYKKQNKIFRAVIVSHRNDIFSGKAKEEYEQLKLMGILVLDGTEGKFRKLHIPQNESYVLIVTHQALTTSNAEITHFEKLVIDMLIYDEVQRITGETLSKLIIKKMPKYLIGTSATPATRNNKSVLYKLFGYPINYISELSCQDAINKKYINDFKITYYEVKDSPDKYDDIKNIYLKEKQKRINENQWFTRKIIMYAPTSNAEKTKLYNKMKELDSEVFDANADASSFEKSNNGNVQLLVACQKYTEGSDIPGIEMEIVIIEGSIEPHILAQIKGRGDRMDYLNQINNLIVIKIIKERDIEDFKKKLIEDISEILGLSVEYILDRFVHECLSGVSGDSDKLTEITDMKLKRDRLTQEIEQKEKEQLIERNENQERVTSNYKRQFISYKRTVSSTENPKKYFNNTKQENIKLNIKDDEEYYKSDYDREFYIDQPKDYKEWKNWYDFLGINTDKFPKTKEDLFKIFREKNPDIKKYPGVDTIKECCKKDDLPYMDLYPDTTWNDCWPVNRGRRGH